MWHRVARGLLLGTIFFIGNHAFACRGVAYDLAMVGEIIAKTDLRQIYKMEKNREKTLGIPSFGNWGDPLGPHVWSQAALDPQSRDLIAYLFLEPHRLKKVQYYVAIKWGTLPEQDSGELLPRLFDQFIRSKELDGLEAELKDAVYLVPVPHNQAELVKYWESLGFVRSVIFDSSIRSLVFYERRVSRLHPLTTP